ncbi:terminase endonuclease subunit [Aeromonas jandaei]|uniref:phage terminase small subunit n=1 Tax=Aeromonas jandaei TaxID=650 RepID=UPI001ADDAAA6|nr:terminase endonuclease subunit [Aeromonas jandaei]QTL95541.1 Phage small terminase subunit [Aeromonas jandaei]
MSSPGQRHKLRVQATQGAELAACTGIATGAVADSLHLQMIALEQDIVRLRNLARIADRVNMKRSELMPKYRPYVERYLASVAESGQPYQNELFQRLIIWAFDIGDLETGIAWALLAIEQNQQTPNNIKRDWAHFVADTVLEWAVKQAAEGHAVEPWFSRVFDKVRNDWRINERISAKWFKAAGCLLLRDHDGQPRPSAVGDSATLEQAAHWLSQAEKLHPKVGVNTLLQKIEMRLRVLNPE